MGTQRRGLETGDWATHRDGRESGPQSMSSFWWVTATGFEKFFSLFTGFPSLLAIRIERRNTVERALFRIVIEISRQKNRTGFGKLDEKHLMAGGVTRSKFQYDRTIAKDVMIRILHDGRFHRDFRSTREGAL